MILRSTQSESRVTPRRFFEHIIPAVAQRCVFSKHEGLEGGNLLKRDGIRWIVSVAESSPWLKPTLESQQDSAHEKKSGMNLTGHDSLGLNRLITRLKRKFHRVSR
ncbi:hypothetical protein WN55_01393 [Dufourea novaeangliae]|uniref:Uncharacterized protein n=1 Tax=Dufourea novaeangliae TaxID=178035 RepID=A0A154PEM1_DUFNO|nr:hypothetical protein WN55_01393 [Dufourea novaeangliae]